MHIKCLIIAIFLKCTSTSEVKHFTKEWSLNFEQDLVIGDFPIGKNSVFPYLKCDNSYSKCLLTLETFRIDGTTYENVCPLPGLLVSNRRNNRLEMRSVFAEIVTLSYFTFRDDETYQIFRNVHMVTCEYYDWSTYRNVDMKDNYAYPFYYQVLSYPQIFFKRDSSMDVATIDDDLQSARTLIHFDPNFEHSPVTTDHLPLEMINHRITLYSPFSAKVDPGMFALVEEYDRGVFGAPKLIYSRTCMNVSYCNNKEHEFSELIDFGGEVKVLDIASSDKTLAVCWQRFEVISCRKFKDDGGDVLGVNLTSLSTLNSIRVYNLPGDELLLLTGLCRNIFTCNIHEELFLRIIRKHDRHGGSLKLANLGCPVTTYRKDVSIYEAVEEGEDYFCVSVACYVKNFLHDVKLISNCYPRSYVVQPMANDEFFVIPKHVQRRMGGDLV